MQLLLPQAESTKQAYSKLNSNIFFGIVDNQIEIELFLGRQYSKKGNGKYENKDIQIVLLPIVELR